MHNIPTPVGPTLFGKNPWQSQSTISWVHLFFSFLFKSTQSSIIVTSCFRCRSKKLKNRLSRGLNSLNSLGLWTMSSEFWTFSWISKTRACKVCRLEHHSSQFVLGSECFRSSCSTSSMKLAVSLHVKYSPPLLEQWFNTKAFSKHFEMMGTLGE